MFGGNTTRTSIDRRSILQSISVTAAASLGFSSTAVAAPNIENWPELAPLREKYDNVALDYSDRVNQTCCPTEDGTTC